MKCVVMANGGYGDLNLYRSIFQEDVLLLCADGGANYARKLNLIPYCIVGDMDSIEAETGEYYRHLNVAAKEYPREKDATDLQLALNMAGELKATDITLLGTLGGRLDHTLSNLYSCMELAEKGCDILHFHPGCIVYITAKNIKIQGRPGDTVSVLALTEQCYGVTEKGFEYPLDNALMEKRNPFAVSNVLTGSNGYISIDKGVLAVFHFLRP